MIKLSKKWSYALKAVLYIAKTGQQVKIADISESLHISEGMLRRIIADLERSGVVITTKGRYGWVKLWKSLSAISVYDILLSVGEELSITDCSKGVYCERKEQCSTTDILVNLQKGFNGLLRLNTLDKIVKF